MVKVLHYIAHKSSCSCSVSDKYLVLQQSKLPDLYEASITELQTGLSEGLFTSVDLVKAYLARIDEVNSELHAVIETNPSVLDQAAALDAERKKKGARSLLHGIPILLKDNIATIHSEGMNTTAGSHALLGSVVPRDATVAAKLRSSGALLLGKTNMSEWANFRGKVPSGFSGRGGQTTNPYYPRANPSGSSSGSAVGMAVGLGTGALGTETDGSIVSPCGKCNVVGVKTTVGLTSRAGVIPISSHQDTVGPMTRCVADAAIILSVISGPDPLDSYTLSQRLPVPDFTKALDVDALSGVRIGVPRELLKEHQDIVDVFDEALEVMRSLGAVIVDPAEFPNMDVLKAIKASERLVMGADFKVDLNQYLSGLIDVPTGVKNLADLIKYNQDHADLELMPPYYADQSQFIASQASEIDATYLAALETNENEGRKKGIDALLEEYNLDAIVVPTGGFGTTPAAIAGYPLISVPLGFHPSDVVPGPAEPIIDRAPGLPFGLMFMGTAYSEFRLVGYAYAYEQATKNRLKKRAYEGAVPKTQLVDVMEKGYLN